MNIVRYLPLRSLFGLAMLGLVATAHADAETIMRAVHDRYTGEDSVSEMRLDYTPPSGSERNIELKVWRKEFGEESKKLMRYIAPKFMSGTGLLIHSFPDSEDRQWLYLSRSERDRPRRIPSSQKDQRLFGTDFFYIDVEDKATRDFEYSLVEQDQGEHNYTVIESVPKRKDYPYDRTLSRVDTDRNLEMHVRFYRDGALQKTLEVREVKKIDGIWTPTRVHMDNHDAGSSTLMSVESIDYNTGVQDDRFTFSALTRGR